jgi:DNA-binding protein H-NS
MATYRELQEQAQKLMEQAEQQRQQELTQALESISKTVSELGISLEELFDYLKTAGFKPARGGRKAKSAKPSKVAAKYQNPSTGETWSGRGRAPGWLREAEEKGKSREKFLVK